MRAYGIAPFSRIQATATVVSSPPENAIPTRSPTGSDVRTRDIGASVSAGRRPIGATSADAPATARLELGRRENAPSSFDRMTPVPVDDERERLGRQPPLA